MAMKTHYECKLKDGKLLNFDCKCNDFYITEHMFVFVSKNTETNAGIILEARNVDEISYVRNEYSTDFYESVMNEKKTDSNIITPNKQIITP
jgi:hypothetical protein